MRSRLLWKLVGINGAVITAAVAVVWLAIDHLAAGYFALLMERYHISPAEAHGLFLGAVHRYLLWASIVAFALALLLSLLLTRRVLRPLSAMVTITRRLATGDYGARVGAGRDDEMGHLGRAFDRMADSLERMDGLRRRMVADAAHELRTPLTSIQGYLEALRDGVVPPSRETFTMLHGEVRRLARLAESLLDLARADSARAHLRQRPVSLRELVEEALTLGRRHLQAARLAVVVEIPPEAHVRADPDRLRQVLRNLVENSGRYATRGGRLEVTAARVPEGVRLCFANDGETFSAEDAPFIFERFYRADRSRAREPGGAGIGLAIVKELVEAHGGTVGAAAEAGRTRIWLTLPAAEPHALRPAATPLPNL